MGVRIADRTQTELAWAAQVAEELLASLDERWRHTLTVVDRARAFRGVLPDGELETPEAAAFDTYVHLLDDRVGVDAVAKALGTGN
ncbi:MAG: hypothetical protein ACRDOS_07060 [Gaiellaceae bacterium]